MTFSDRERINILEEHGFRALLADGQYMYSSADLIAPLIVEARDVWCQKSEQALRSFLTNMKLRAQMISCEVGGFIQ